MAVVAPEERKKTRYIVVFWYRDKLEPNYKKKRGAIKTRYKKL